MTNVVYTCSVCGHRMERSKYVIRKSEGHTVYKSVSKQGVCCGRTMIRRETK